MSDERYCGNTDVLMSYLYEEGEADERQAFEAHLATCQTCAGEVDAMRKVRKGLAAWEPPETLLDFHIVRDREVTPRRRGWFAIPQMPAWAQFAAASLVVGVAVGVSGLEVRYDQQGLSVRAGWSKPAAPASSPSSTAPDVQPTVAAAATEAPWRTELTAFEQRLMDQVRQPRAGETAAVTRPASSGAQRPMSDDEFMARVRDLIAASESRQQHELAVRLTQVVRDMDTQRRTDLARVVDGFGALEGRTGAAVARQGELLNYLVRVSQKQQ